MAINITNEAAEQSIRKLSEMTKLNLTETVALAVREAIERRLNKETPLETAAKLRDKYRLSVRDNIKQPLPREAFTPEGRE